MGLEYKATGVLHLIAIGVIIFYLLTNALPKLYVLFAISFFIIKGIIFTIMKKNILSFLDTIAGIYFLFSVFDIFSNIFLNVISIGFLVQKGIFYLFR